MGDLLNWLLEEGNKKSCRVVGLFFTIFPLLFFFGGGFTQSIDDHSMIFSAGWFREVFLVILIFMFLIGLILVIAGFSKRKNHNKDI